MSQSFSPTRCVAPWKHGWLACRGESATPAIIADGYSTKLLVSPGQLKRKGRRKRRSPARSAIPPTAIRKSPGNWRNDTFGSDARSSANGRQPSLIILIEAERRQIYASRELTSHGSQLLHARFQHLSFVPRGHGGRVRPSFTRLIFHRKFYGLRRLAPAPSVSPAGEA